MNFSVVGTFKKLTLKVVKYLLSYTLYWLKNTILTTISLLKSLRKPFFLDLRLSAADIFAQTALYEVLSTDHVSR